MALVVKLGAHPRRRIPASPVLAVLFALLLGGCLGNYGFMVSAPPIASTVRLVEESPEVARALGGPVKVSLMVTRTLRRDPIRALGGDDHVSLLTTAKGPRGEATLRVSAMNLGGQGWSGDFVLEQAGAAVYRDGRYVTDGGGTLLAGRFDQNGNALSGQK